MPLVLADRVKETTTTAGTGTITLAGAATGFQSFAVVGNGNTTYYTIAGQNTSEWEVGIGTYTSSGTTLSRDTVLASSAGAPTKTNFSAGTKDVFVTYTAARSVYVDGSTLDTAGMGAAQGDILYASATDVFSRLVKNSTATRYLANTGVSNDPQWDQINLANGVTGSLAATNGGTGQTSYAVGDLLYADSTTSLTKLADVATGNALISGGVGVAPSYGKIGLTTHVSGTLPIDNGGSGQTTAQAAMNAFAGAVTSGSYLRGNGTDVVMSTIQAADVPTLNQNTTGSAGSVANALTAGTGITYSSGTTYNGSAAITISIGQAVGTSSNVQFNSIGVGTAASGTTGEIRATNNVTAYFSDDRLKDKLGKIENALDKLCSLEGFYYKPNEIAQSLGYEVVREVGISAQQMKAVLPEIVAPAPIDAQYMTVRYERALPLIVEAIKELRAEVDALKKGV